MTLFRIAALVALLLSPSMAFAHGEEILGTVVIDILHIIILILVLFVLKLNRIAKLLIILIYMAVVFGLNFWINSMKLSDYRESMPLINFVLFLVPFIALILPYYALKNKFGNKA